MLPEPASLDRSLLSLSPPLPVVPCPPSRRSNQVGADGVALMVQVASSSVVVVEYPRGRCSAPLAALFADPSVTKVLSSS